MSNNTTPVSVRILDKDYRISCPTDEQDGLIKASIHLNEKMNQIKSNGKLIGNERVAVMAALNIAYELLQLKENSDTVQDCSTINQQIQQLQDKVEHALYEGRQLEF